MKLKVRDATIIEVHLPIRTVSEANVRECWQAKHRRAKGQKEAVGLMLNRYRRSLQAHGGRFYVTLTRVGVRKLDGDNLQRSFKAIRDQVAETIGIDDGSERIEWKYAQGKGKYGVKVTIEINHQRLTEPERTRK